MYKVALSRRIEKHWRLIGWGSLYDIIAYYITVC